MLGSIRRSSDAAVDTVEITPESGAGNRDRQVGRRRSSAPTPARPAGGVSEIFEKSREPARRSRLLQRLTVPYGLVWIRELDLQAACRTTLLNLRPLSVCGRVGQHGAHGQ